MRMSKKSPADEVVTEVMAEAPSKPVKVRCRQTGFQTEIPATDWAAYTDDQQDAYEVIA